MQADASEYKLKIGDPMPRFEGLVGVDGKAYSWESFKTSKATVIFWHCNHCPYSQAFEDRLNQATRDYAGKGVAFLAINSNDEEEYEEDSLPHMRERAKEKGLQFPFAFDATQQVAEDFGALCTPHVFVFDKERRLVYQGRVDGEKENPDLGRAVDLRDALDDVLAGRKVRTPLTRAFGCSVKWGKEHFARVGTHI